MASVGDRLLCENCGNLIGYWQKNSVGETKPPNNAVIHSYLGFAPTYFCTKRCKEEWKERKKS